MSLAAVKTIIGAPLATIASGFVLGVSEWFMNEPSERYSVASVLYGSLSSAMIVITYGFRAWSLMFALSTSCPL